MEKNASLFWSLLKKEIHGRYLSSNLGALWLFLQPLMMLLIYQFVFERIFKIRFPGMEEHGFLLFVAAGLWPWFAFSEGLLNATRTLEKHSDLLKKVYINPYLLVLVEVAAPFCIHILGFIAIMLLFVIFNQAPLLGWLMLSLLLWLPLLVLTYALSLLFSALHIFLRDVAQVLQTALMLWFYLTPIVYPLALVPDRFRKFLWFNPLAEYMMLFRAFLLEGTLGALWLWGIALSSTLILFIPGYFVFKRLKPYFEDML